MDPKTDRRNSPGLTKALAVGLMAALCLGVAAGWLRYWFGVFILLQGAAVGLLVAFMAGRSYRGGGQEPRHPGFSRALGISLVWLCAFLVGELIGIGLAQPWFEPVGWLGRLLSGRTAEHAFGVAATGPIHRGFSLVLSGWSWVVLNAIDVAMMFFFFLAMPWVIGRGEKKPAKGRSPETAP